MPESSDAPYASYLNSEQPMTCKAREAKADSLDDKSPHGGDEWRQDESYQTSSHVSFSGETFRTSSMSTSYSKTKSAMSLRNILCDESFLESAEKDAHIPQSSAQKTPKLEDCTQPQNRLHSPLHNYSPSPPHCRRHADPTGSMNQDPAANSLPQAILNISPTYDAKHFNKVVVGTQGGNNLASERKARRCLGKSDTQRQKKRDSKAQQAALDCYVSTLTLIYDGAIADLNCGSDDSFDRQVSSFSEEI
ncbi:hypothetical protein GQ607_011441 [Colletotrichum asianum]|uniref:Uncharacterized protein n=1 Tax=Colletotrichum asianum TaxID=702518 RepID=A0A8H3W4S1_9PEZI|nr:hypothetical protein GQ607_011441 [Colletotrichum asianum]